jgi:hypothetical protein
MPANARAADEWVPAFAGIQIKAQTLGSAGGRWAGSRAYCLIGAGGCGTVPA